MTAQRMPVIGITCSELAAERTPPRFGQNQSYIRAVSRAGATPLLIPHLPDAVQWRALYDLCDGLLLPGGADIDPVRYHQEMHPKCGEPSPLRDEIELTLARWAMAERKPLLAICRGIQVLNVAMGGSLYQDIAAQLPAADRHDWFPGFPRNRLSHVVEIEAGSLLAQVVGEPSLAVNSLHHQAVQAVAPGLRVSGRAPDGIVEALEAVDHPFALAVQWHPEELAEEDYRARALFDVLVQACRR